MSRFIASLKDKRFRYGTFSTVMVLFAVILFLLINLVVEQMDITVDLTRNQMYSLSKDSKDFIKTVNEDITIYALFRTGQEHLMLKQIVEEYASLSSRIRVEYRDPLIYPTFVNRFAKPDEEILENSVIVENAAAGKFKVIHPSEMVTYESGIDPYTYQYYQELTSINFEPQISRAIHYVTLGESPVIYHVKGSNEFELSEDLIKFLEEENYEVRDVNLVFEEVPEDCGILLVTLPRRDWTADQAERVLNYLQNNGRAVFLLGYDGQERFTNLYNVLAAYGVALGDYMVFEGDSRRFYANNPSYIIPQFISNDITQPLINKRYANLFIQSTGIDLLEIRKTNTQIDPFLTTSRASYAKNNKNAETVNKEPGDIDGPFNLGVTIEDSYYTNQSYTTKMVVFSCENIMDSYVNTVVGGTNWELILNAVNWLQEQPPSIYIPAKTPARAQPLMLSQNQANMMAFVSIGALPVAFIALGLVVWFRRRHN